VSGVTKLQYVDQLEVQRPTPVIDLSGHVHMGAWVSSIRPDRVDLRTVSAHGIAEMLILGC
jgi:hypothetical protein